MISYLDIKNVLLIVVVRLGFLAFSVSSILSYKRLVYRTELFAIICSSEAESA